MEQQASFPRQHIAMALKYGGISFIAGSVNHGAFSGSRSLITAGLGVISFIFGMWLESKNSEQAKAVSPKTVALSTLLAIGLGLFAGGLQHFPDSPSRSVWAVPLGFVITLSTLFFITQQSWSKIIQGYLLASLAAVALSVSLAFQYYSVHPAAAHEHGSEHIEIQASASHEHTDEHAHQAETAIGLPGNTTEVARTVVVDMADTMRFSPENLSVKQGETVRLVVRNTGNLRHELTLGTIADLKEHAALMLKHPNMQHKDPNMVQVDPGEVKEVVWKFSKAGKVDFACLQPGHFEAGMKGLVQVTQ